MRSFYYRVDEKGVKRIHGLYATVYYGALSSQVECDACCQIVSNSTFSFLQLTLNPHSSFSCSLLAYFSSLRSGS
jgi:hypothetical protein